MKTHALRALIISALVTIVLYLGFIAAGDYDEIRLSLSRFGLWECVLVFGLSLINYGLRFMRWHWYFQELGYDVPVRTNLAYYLTGFAFTTTPGKAGEAVRSVYLKAHGVSYSDSLAALFTERLMDLLAMVSLAALVISYFPDYQWLIVVLSLAILAVFLTLQHERSMRWLQHRLAWFLRNKLTTLVDTVFKLLHTSTQLLRSRLLYSGFLVGMLAWGAEGLAFYFILAFLDIDTPITIAIGIYAVSMLVGALSFIPGGLGSTEVVMGLLLLLIGADTTDAVVATVFCRIATLWFAVVIGAATMVWLESRRMSSGQALE